MKRNNNTEPTNGMLTNPMDTGTDEFKDFQAIMLNKAKSRSEPKKREIELLSIKFQMQDYLESEETEPKLPGEFLKEYLKTLGIPQKKFAHYIEINPSNLYTFVLSILTFGASWNIAIRKIPSSPSERPVRVKPT